MKNFIDWFDPFNKEHLRAYQHLNKKGFWPEGFIPDDVELDSLWLMSINHKMTLLWVQSRLE
jgi:hypothetical protein